MSTIANMVGVSPSEQEHINSLFDILKHGLQVSLPFAQRIKMFGSVSRQSAINRHINSHFDIDVLIVSDFATKYIYPRVPGQPAGASSAPPAEMAAWNFFNPDNTPPFGERLLIGLVKMFNSMNIPAHYESPCAVIQVNGYRFDLVYADASTSYPDEAILLQIRKPILTDGISAKIHDRYKADCPGLTIAAGKGDTSTTSIVYTRPWLHNMQRDHFISTFTADPSDALLIIKYVFLVHKIAVPSYYLEFDFYRWVSKYKNCLHLSNLYDLVVHFFDNSSFHFPKLYERYPNFIIAQRLAREYLFLRDNNRDDAALACLNHLCPVPDIGARS